MMSGGLGQEVSPWEECSDIKSNTAELSSPFDIMTVLKKTFTLARTDKFLADLSHD
jgi:hypothetical protein